MRSIFVQLVPFRVGSILVHRLRFVEIERAIPYMQRRACQKILRLFIVFTIMVGLVHSPLGKVVYDGGTSALPIEAVQHADGLASHSHKLSDFGFGHEDESNVSHDTSDHSHNPSSLPPSMLHLAFSSKWTRLAEVAPVAPHSVINSLDRPPKPTDFG